MNDIDVSIVFNMHREALFLPPTLFSLDECVAEARRTGLKIELIAVFDRADDATRMTFAEHDFSGYDRVEVVEVDVGSLGLARNAGIERATGDYVWTSDADDLVSSNAIVSLYKTAKDYIQEKVVVFLEYLCAFGEQYHNVRYINSSFLTAADFAYQHPYVSRIFTHRSTFDSMKYDDLRVTSGFAYEDWYLNCQLRAAGYMLVVAPDTVLFYRQRRGSLLRQANAASVRLIPHSQLFDVDVFLADMARCRNSVDDWCDFLVMRAGISDQNNTDLFMSSPKLVAYLLDAMRLEPEIEPDKVATAGSYSPMPWRKDHWGIQLERLYRMIGDQGFTDVVMLPWLNAGGAEKYILQILSEISRVESDSKILVISGEACAHHDWKRLLPENSVFLDIFNAFPMLESDDSDAMLMRALLAIAKPSARMHIKSSVFAHRFLDSYSPVLYSIFRIVYYRFADGNFSWRGRFYRGGWGAKFMRSHLPGFWRVLSDCSTIVESDKKILGSLVDYRIVYAQCDVVDAHEIDKRKAKKKLLWASRISPEKRPELLSIIVDELEKQGVDVCIDAYGSSDSNEIIGKYFTNGESRLTYRGAFSSVAQLPLENYDAFIYTSAYDGLPNIILEVMSSGLPVIAPNVGGIGEIVMSGKTGWLLNESDDKSLVISYVDSIKALYSDWDSALKMGASGRDLVMSRHSRKNHSINVAAALSL